MTLTCRKSNLKHIGFVFLSFYFNASIFNSPFFPFRAAFRYRAVLLRQRFEATRNEKDVRRLAAMVEEGEEEVFQRQHPTPKIFKCVRLGFRVWLHGWGT